MKKSVLFLLIVLAYVCLFPACNSEKTSSTSTSLNEIDAVLNELVQENEIPGLCFSIIRADGSQESYAAGFSDVEHHKPLTTDHVLFSGSIGKTYAVAVLMQLVDEGRIHLSDRIIDHFPEVPWLKRLPNMNEITVAMCLQHTTGLPRYAMQPEVWEILRDNPDKVWSYKDRLAIIFDDAPLHEAGKGWAYSDTNYILLGMLIEKVTGNGVYDEMKSRVLEPQGLTRTYPSLTRDMPNLPIGYSRLPDKFCMPEKTVTNGRYVFNPQMEWTGGGFASTTSDLARWAKIYYEGKLFSANMLKRITTPNSQGINIQENESYGMGSFIYETPHGKCFAHTGFFPGFMSVFAYYPDRKVAVALQINCDYAKKNMSLIGYLNRILPVALGGDRG